MNNVILRAISLTLLASVAACNGSDNKSTTPPVTTGDDASIFANLNAQIAGLDADAKAKQTTIDAQNQRIEALAQAQADAKALAAAEEAAKAQAARSDADQQAALVKRIGELEQKLAAGPAISPEVEARLSSLKDLIDTLADAPKFDPATLALLEGQIAGLQTELAKMAKSESVTALEQSLGTLKTTLADPAKLTSLGTDMDKVKLDLEVLTTLTKDLDPETLAELKATLASLRTDIDGKMSIDPATIKSISERLAEVEQALAALPLAVAADDSPAARALVRLLPNHFSQVAFVRIEKLAGAQDSYRIFGNEGAITIEATSPATFLTGLGEYLEQVAHVSIGWPGDSLDKLAAKLPAPSTEIKRTANVKDRFALNDTDDSYADAYKTWPEWERKIDLLAMHGMNEVFIPVGTEEVYRETFKQFGYSDEEIRAWIPAPAHQPWWLLQNMAEEHGPMSVELYQRRVEIGQKITKRLVELGMTPVLPGYFGTVPTKFKEKHPTAALVPQGKWSGEYVRPDWLDPRTELFRNVAAVFYQKQSALFGNTTMYKMDLLHEGGVRGTIPVTGAADGVRDALLKAHPGAVWVLLGWENNPPQDIVKELTVSQVLMVDGLSDQYAIAKVRETAWLSRPYAFGMINNYGGRTTIGANGSAWLSRFYALRNKVGNAMTGTAYLREATGIDPAAFELFSDLAWHDTTFSLDDWFIDYSTYRYGGADDHAANAWKIIGRTAYSLDFAHTKLHDSIFGAKPALNSTGAWSTASVRYDAKEFAKALPELLAVAEALRGSTAYRYDLVNIARQVLSNQSRVLLPKIKAAYDSKDKVRFGALTGVWLDYMRDLDTLLATDQNFLLANFLAGAKAAASNESEMAQLQYDQRSLLTTWGSKVGLQNYASREISGLVGGLHVQRWTAFFASLSDALESGTTPKDIDWFAMEDTWAKKIEPLSNVPAGDAYVLAKGILDKIAKEPQ